MPPLGRAPALVLRPARWCCGRAGGAAGQGGFGRGQGGRRGLVFVSKDKKYAPRIVRLGVSNFDYSEVLRGLQEGEQVAILNVAVLQARQQRT